MIASARRIVESRCAMTNAVRFIMRLASASCTSSSLSVSSAEVASSSTRIGAFLSSARALALASRETLAALADHRVVALREAEDEIVGVRGTRGGLDLLARGGWRTV